MKKRKDSESGMASVGGAVLSQKEDNASNTISKDDVKVNQSENSGGDLNEADTSDKADPQTKKFQGHRRAFSQVLTIPPPPWERKSVDVDQSKSDTIVRRSSTGDLQALDRIKDTSSKTDSAPGEAAALAGEEGGLEMYSPRLEGKTKGDGKGKKAKFGTKAADLFAKLQSRLSASKT